jgi:WD40 repeat protein
MGVQQGGVLLWEIAEAAVESPRLNTGVGDGDVLGLSYSPDGSQLAYSTSVGEAGILDSSTLAMMRGLYGHSERVERAVFSPDANTIAAASWDSTVRLWDAKTGRPLRTLLGHRLPVARCAFSIDGKRLYSGSADNTLRMWDLSSDDRVALAHPSNRVQWFTAESGGRWVAAAYSSSPRLDGLVLWNVAQRRPIATLYQHASKQNPPCEVIRTALNADGTRFAGAFCDGTVKVWDAAHLEDLAQTTAQGAVDPASEALSNLPTVEPLLTLSKPAAGRLTAITFSHDGARIFAGGEGFLHAWDARSGESLATWTLQPAPVSALIADPTGQYLLRGTWDKSGGVIQVIDVETGAVRETLRQPGRTLENLTFSRDGRWLASASFNGAVCLWDWPTRTLHATLTSHAGPVVSLAFSPDGSRLASASHDHTIKLWSPETGQLMATLHGHSYLVNCVAFTADGWQLISASADRTVRFWDSASSPAR